jgi:dTDP-4-dehydrorhamnose reductase
MILLLGASGYIGQAFQQELENRRWPQTLLSRKQLDYSKFDLLLTYLREKKPSFVLNAAGYTGKPNVDACETARADTLQGNTLLPLTIAHACVAADIPFGHVSSGCIYSGAYIVENGNLRAEKDMARLVGNGDIADLAAQAHALPVKLVFEDEKGLREMLVERLAAVRKHAS